MGELMYSTMFNLDVKIEQLVAMSHILYIDSNNVFKNISSSGQHNQQKIVKM